MKNSFGLARKSVVALAGRRIDAEGVDRRPRFPISAVPLVGRRISDLLLHVNAAALVSSAACGSDLIALEEATRLGIRRRVVLPFPPGCFRLTSVIDRPGNWGPLFDCLIEELRSAGELVVLGGTREIDAYTAANEAIVREAQAIARASGDRTAFRLVAVVVWEGATLKEDATDDFRVCAAAAGMEVHNISTLEI